MADEVREAEEQVQRLLISLPNLPDESAPTQEGEVLREVGEAGKEGKDHLELLGDYVDMEAGARVSGSRFAYLKGPRRAARVRARALGSRGARRSRLHPGGAAGAGPRGGALRHRLPARHRAADLPPARGRPLPRRAPRRCRWPRCTRARSWTWRRCRSATPASRPASAARPAPPARTRAGSSACTSSTSSRCSRSCRRRSRRPSTSACSRSRRSCCRHSTSPTAW